MIPRKYLPVFTFLVFMAVLVPTAVFAGNLTDRIDLTGQWRFRLDPQDTGERARWFAETLGDETIPLPGTTDRARKGYPLNAKTMRYAVAFEHSTFPGKPMAERMDERGFLVRPFMYIGPAWYERTIIVPERWKGKILRLFLERVMWSSHVWVDGREIGSQDSLMTPHVHILGPLRPGPHRLTVRIDNSMLHNSGTIGHGYGPETQSRWNGIVGRIELIASDPLWLSDLQVYPAADGKTLRVRATIANQTGKRAAARLLLVVHHSTATAIVGSLTTDVEIGVNRQVVERAVPITKPIVSWDEFHPVRYRLTAELSAERYHHVARCTFGFRDIRRDGRHILVNARRIFLRGTLDCCVYPRTGHPPVTVDEWLRVLGTVKRYGFNHVRFHTWCPPEAAFEAADRLGVYLAPETSFWVDGWMLDTYSHPKALGHDPDVTDFVRREIRRISDAYGNHPSFAFFCIGNEFALQATDWNVVDQILNQAKQDDPRHLYNGSTARKRVAADDFWVTHTTGKSTRGVGPPHTDWDFSSAAEATDLPVVAHETGQRPVFPDYDHLLPKFTGPLKPLNYVRLRDAMVKAGLAGRVESFHRASARFQIIQYKAEHEGMLRTADCAGYQLLMLNDFTGQSEALVGILDPFWDEKGIVPIDQVRQWNNSTVPLARFKKHVWSTGESFAAEIEVAHFGPADLLDATARCMLTATDGRVIAERVLAPKNVPTGKLTKLGDIEIPLDSLQHATAMILTVRLGEVTNQWKLWAYPPTGRMQEKVNDVLVVTKFDERVERTLNNGGRVLLLHGERNEYTGSPGFLAQYWSGGWWGSNYSHLGLVCDPQHPALAEFPNDGHSDWQWYDLFHKATTWDLTDLAPRQQPIVQLVSDFHYNRRLAQVFEATIGRGRLLACGYDLTSNLERRHAARQMRRSLLRYMQSDKFVPNRRMALATARTLFRLPFTQRLAPKVVSFDRQASRYEAGNAIDGNLKTFWHTPWQKNVTSFPHHLTIAWERPVAIAGLRVWARQDNNPGGRIKAYRVFVSKDGVQWSTAITEGELADHTRPQTIRFPSTTARAVRFEALSSHEGKAWASLAELELVPAEVVSQSSR